MRAVSGGDADHGGRRTQPADVARLRPRRRPLHLQPRELADPGRGPARGADRPNPTRIAPAAAVAVAGAIRSPVPSTSTGVPGPRKTRVPRRLGSGGVPPPT